MEFDLRPRKLDVYIVKKFISTFFVALLLIIGIVIIFDISEKIDNFVEKEAPLMSIIFDYYLNLVPYYANTFSALFVFIAVIYFTSKLAETSEIIAMFAAGVSFKRLLRPYMISAAIIAALTFVLSAYVIPIGNKTRIEFEVKHKRRDVVETARNIQLQVDDSTVAYFERYDSRTRTGYRFSLDKFRDKKLVSHMTARTITYHPEEKHKWTAKNWMIRELNNDKEAIRSELRIPLDTIIKIEPGDFLISEGQQETMTSPQLSEYIDKQKARGMANIKPFEVEYHKRIAMSFAAFILTLIGASLSSKKTKGGMGLSLGIGLGLSFSYILFQAISSAFAEQMPVFLAVWLPNIVYAFIALYLYKKAPK